MEVGRLVGKASRALIVNGFVGTSVMALAWMPPAAIGVNLLGTTALIMGGTGQPFVNPFVRDPNVDGLPSYPFAQWGLTDADGQPAGYVKDVLDHYIIPNLPEGDDALTTKVVWNPNEIWPFIGSRTFDASVATGAAQLNNCLTSPQTCVSHVYPDGEAGDSNAFSVFGYSQSATAASQVKAALIEKYGDDPESAPQDINFTFIGNPNRPNGGLLERFTPWYFPIANISFNGSSPTNSPVVGDKFLYPTADIARQYDFFADFPKYPLNLLADYNALMGLLFLHLDYFNTSDAGTGYLDQGQIGDTHYYMISTPVLPMLIPLELFVPLPLLKVIDAPLRVLVELGYDRETDAGTPTTGQIFGPNIDLFKVAGNLITSVFVGMDDGEARLHAPTVVFVDQANSIRQLRAEVAGPATAPDLN